MATAGTLAPSPDRRWKLEEDDAPEPPPLIAASADAIDWKSRIRRAGPVAISFSTSVLVHLILLLTAALVGVSLSVPPVPLIAVQGGLIETAEEMETLEIPLAEATGEAQAEDDGS